MSHDVTIGFIHNGRDVGANFLKSMLAMNIYDINRNKRIYGFIDKMAPNSSWISKARNDVVDTWISNSDTPWLLWIDTDTGFKVNYLDLMLEVADPETSPVVSGVCPNPTNLTSDGLNGYTYEVRSEFFRYDEDIQGWVVRDSHHDIDELQRFDAVGTGFCLVHRSVFERMSELYRRKRAQPWKSWYSVLRRSDNPDEFWQEDLSFSLRLRELGIRPLVYSKVSCNHMKTTWLR